MPPAVTEAHVTGLVLSEHNGHQSRENVVLVLGQNLKYGAVVGKITDGGKYAVYANGASDGSEVAAGILVGGDVNATDADKPAVILVKDAEVNEDLVGWGASDSTGITAGKADLAALGIKFRPGV